MYYEYFLSLLREHRDKIEINANGGKHNLVQFLLGDKVIFKINALPTTSEEPYEYEVKVLHSGGLTLTKLIDTPYTKTDKVIINTALLLFSKMMIVNSYKEDEGKEESNFKLYNFTEEIDDLIEALSLSSIRKNLSNLIESVKQAIR